MSNPSLSDLITLWLKDQPELKGWRVKNDLLIAPNHRSIKITDDAVYTKARQETLEEAQIRAPWYKNPGWVERVAKKYADAGRPAAIPDEKTAILAADPEFFTRLKDWMVKV